MRPRVWLVNSEHNTVWSSVVPRVALVWVPKIINSVIHMKPKKILVYRRIFSSYWDLRTIYPMNSHKGNAVGRKLRINTGDWGALWHFSEEVKQES